MVIVDYTKQSRHWLELMIWWFAVEEFDDGASQAPDVRSSGGTSQFNDFRSHPVWGANDTCFIHASSLGSHTEICEFDEAFFGGEDVGAFDITMDDTLFVEIVQSIEYLRHVDCNQVLWELAEILQNLVKGTVLAIPKPY